MGFPYFSFKLPKSIDVSFLLNLLGHFKFMVMVALTHLGLSNTSQGPQQEAFSEELSANYVFIDWPTPSLVPIPVHILTASIKKRLPVVEYSEFLKKFSLGEKEDAVCTICLSSVEKSHEIRELSNCCHLFHRDCLDKWVDVGQVTCPLCRSMLFPAKGDMKRCGGDPWLMERNAYLFGEGHVMTTS
ncbi:hypothetical protein L1049_022492 [Liquidambar formosana]|uniref:RING-type domain-containing protein n=1 Tax=Liquidambar formosana TaxID=63359 RepID=A0AAP0WRI1_LIQFO